MMVRFYSHGWRKGIADRLWRWGVPDRAMCWLGFAMRVKKKRPSAVMDNFGLKTGGFK